MSTKHILSVSDAKEQFTDLINRVSHHKEHIIITRRDKELVALVPIEDLRLIEDSQNKSDLEEAVLALKEIRAEGTITLLQLKQELHIG